MKRHVADVFSSLEPCFSALDVEPMDEALVISDYFLTRSEFQCS